MSVCTKMLFVRNTTDMSGSRLEIAIQCDCMWLNRMNPNKCNVLSLKQTEECTLLYLVHDVFIVRNTDGK